MASKDVEFNYGIGIIGIILTAIFLIGVFYGCVYFYKVLVSQQQTYVQTMMVTPDLDRLRVQETEQLMRLEWKNKTQRTVYVPIAVAMARIVDDYQRP